MKSPSFRSTTSSRHPGVAIEGVVHVERGRIVTCEKCGKKRLVYSVPPSPHSLHWIERNGEMIKIDCTGEEIF